MTRTYNVIDSDGHVLEPADLWTSYIDPVHRNQAPEIFVDDDGMERVRFEGMVMGGALGLGMAGAVAARLDAIETPRKYVDGRAGGFNPKDRIADLDLDGIDAVFLYPTIGLFSGVVQDPGLAAAICRAYNRWLADFCSHDNDRLFGVAMLPMQSVSHVVDEMCFAREELGLRAGFIRPNPYNSRLLNDPAYDPIWAAAQDLDIAIGIHEGSGGMPAATTDRVPDYGARHIASHTVEMMLASLGLIWGGVCERFPRARFAFLESGGGWMAPWLERMDRHFDQGFNDPELVRMPPSDYFRRQCWISFEPVEQSLPSFVTYLGETNILWATDYPHSDGYFPGAPKMIADRLPEKDRRSVLAKGAMRFYNLT